MGSKKMIKRMMCLALGTCFSLALVGTTVSAATTESKTEKKIRDIHAFSEIYENDSATHKFNPEYFGGKAVYEGTKLVYYPQKVESENGYSYISELSVETLEGAGNYEPFEVAAKDANGIPTKFQIDASKDTGSYGLTLSGTDSKLKDAEFMVNVFFDEDVSQAGEVTKKDNNATTDATKAKANNAKKSDAKVDTKKADTAKTAKTATKKPEDKKLDGSPKTADASSTGVMVAMMAGCASVLALVTVFVMKRRKDNIG